MLILPRTSVRAFRAVLRKCSGGRTRPFTPPVLLHAENNQIALLASTVDVAVRLIVPKAEGQGSFVMPMKALESYEGPSESVEIVGKGKGKAVARWSNRGLPQELAIDLLPPTRVPMLLELPNAWSEASEELLQAMHEAGKSTTRDAGRYSLQRIQVNGSQGKICGTDGHQALIHGGFTFPFPETLHLPALPVFGAKEFTGLPVRCGRTESHCVFEIGPWTLWLSIDFTAKFPDLEAAVPLRKNATTIAVSDTDAAFLLDLLPQFPGHDAEDAPITVVVRNSLIAVRGQGVKDAKPAEVFLTGSTATGPPVRVAIKRRFLLRALSLGLRKLRLVENANAFVAAADNQVYLASVLDPSMCLGVQDTPPAKVMVPSSPQETTMPKPNPEAESVQPDLLTEAESLRSDIYEIGQRISRIITILKSKKKDERTLNQVFTSLKALQLGGPPR
jgi:hypothetical protein